MILYFELSLSYLIFNTRSKSVQENASKQAPHLGVIKLLALSEGVDVERNEKVVEEVVDQHKIERVQADGQDVVQVVQVIQVLSHQV